MFFQPVAGGREQQPSLERQTRHLKRAVGGGIEADVLAVVPLRLRGFVVPAAAKVDRQGASHAPVVLHEDPVIVITPCRIGIEYRAAARGIAQQEGGERIAGSGVGVQRIALRKAVAETERREVIVRRVVQIHPELAAELQGVLIEHLVRGAGRVPVGTGVVIQAGPAKPGVVGEADAREKFARRLADQAGGEPKHGRIEPAAIGEIGEVVLRETKTGRDDHRRRQRGSHLHVGALVETLKIVRPPGWDGPSVIRPGLPPAVAHIADAKPDLVRQKFVTLQGIGVVALFRHDAARGAGILESLGILREIRQRDVIQQLDGDGIE